MFLIENRYWKIRKTTDKGNGVFAKKEIAKGTIIGDYAGKLINYLEVDYKAENKQMYLMYYNDKYGIYPDLSKPGIHLINHSCSPNCWFAKFKDRILVFALRNISKGDEITINYLLPPKDICKNCSHTCCCDSLKCTRSMHLTQKKYDAWLVFKKNNWIRSKTVGNSRYLKPLKTYPKKVSANYMEKLSETGLLDKTT